MPGTRREQKLEADALVPIISGARARRLHGFCGPLGLALTDAVCLWLFLNLVNDHASRLVVRERLRVIAVARMHPHA